MTWSPSGPSLTSSCAPRYRTAVMPIARAPATSVRRRSPTWAAALGRTPRYPRACSKISGAGLYHPTSSENDHPSKQPRRPKRSRMPAEAGRRREADVADDAEAHAPPPAAPPATTSTPSHRWKPASSPAVTNRSTRSVPHPLAHRQVEQLDRRPRRALAGVLLVAQPRRLVLVPDGAERRVEQRPRRRAWPASAYSTAHACRRCAPWSASARTMVFQ